MQSNSPNDNNNENKNLIAKVEDENTMTNPSLPPLYFQEEQFSMFALCSELETNILSYLTWGDHARLAGVSPALTNILDDAAQQSEDATWSLAQSLLNGQNGVQVNPTLAIKYLQQLAGVTLAVSKDDFNPSYKQMNQQSTMTMSTTMSTTTTTQLSLSQEQQSQQSQESHSIMAMRKIASCYLEGNGVEADQTMGIQWLHQAYHHGDLNSAFEIASIYENGNYGVDVDIYRAAEWFHGAATAGHVESMAEYAMCLELGSGVDQSDHEALDWYTQAAERGCPTSNFSVGEWFECARGGLPQSDTEAVLWYYKAASLGDEDSKKALKRLNDIARIVIPGWDRMLNV